MKYIHMVFVRAFILVTVFALNHSSAQSGYIVTERGADYKVLQKTTVEHGTNRVHRYTELATGMNYTNSFGQLVESKEQITILPTGGAAATQGRHKVYFPADIYNGVLEVVTPDGRHLRSRPLGVSYDDGSNTVFIAELKHAIGWLTSSNTVTYRDAFTGFKADLVCTYRRGGFECDLVFRQQPPTPDQFGLDASFSTLQLVTEFFNTQDPQEIPAQTDAYFGLQDITLKFGALTMTHGKAFGIKTESGNGKAETTSSPVYKSWVHLQGRTFLIEAVPLVDIADDLDALPLTASLQPSESGIQRFASSRREFLPSHELVADTNQILIASANVDKQPGVVLDYSEEINSDQTDFPFKDGGTYYVSGSVCLSGTTTFEGGAVLKFNNNDNWGSLNLDESSTVVCASVPEHPTVFTSVNDDTVGEIIPGSSGSPGVYDLNGFLNFNCPSVVLSNLCCYYVCDGIQIYGDMDLWNCQLMQADFAVSAYQYYDENWNFCGGNVRLHNVLIQEIWGDAPVWAEGSATAENVTLNGYPSIGAGARTNCLIVCEESEQDGVPFEPAGNEWVVSPDGSSAVFSPNPVFATAASAHYYLAANSPYRHAGTTNISPALLAELQTMTTYAPPDGGWPDTNGTDLGYHYPVNEDSDYDGLPDWWEWKYFGSYSQSGTNDYDGDGVSNLDEYLNGTDPNKILFQLESANDYVNHTNVSVQLDVTAGTPSYYAIFVNQTATTNWWPFTTTNLTTSLGATDGVYEVVVGLKGLPADATETWQDYTFTLDRVAPVLTITNPIIGGNAVTKPYLQLQGFANEQLSSLSYDISNATGIATNQDAFVIDQCFDTNQFDFTTNYFQAYDVPLATNVNSITLRVTDRAGNTTTTNFNVVLDYTTATNAPVVTLIWPQDGMAVSGTNITMRGTMSDETGTIVALVVNGDGTTNIITGLVERNNMFWIENMPLNGTNQITLQATDAAGNVATTNFTVLPSSLVLTITNTPTGDDLYKPSGSVSGTVSDPTATVTVNGMTTTVNGNSWSADNVPIFGKGTATFDASAVTANDQTAAADVSKEMEPYWTIAEHHATKNDGGTDGFTEPTVTSVWNYFWQKDYWDTSTNSLQTGLRHGTIDDHYKITTTQGQDIRIYWDYQDYAWTNLTGICHYTDSDGHDYSDSFDPCYVAPGGGNAITFVPDTDLLVEGHYNDAAPQAMYHYFANNVHYHWKFHFPGPGWVARIEQFDITARTRVMLYTGGKSGVNRQSLFCISAKATKYEQWSPDYYGWQTTDMDKSGLRVLGKWVGADGKLWVALPDNSAQDITVAAGARHYSAEATPTKYKLVITANYDRLYPDKVVLTKFCVGQNITFRAGFEPALPESPLIAPILWGLEGIYYNDEKPTVPGGTFPSCSIDYFVNPDKLANPTTTAWWVSGGAGDDSDVNTPAKYLAAFGEGLTFNNGQYVAVAANGKFEMYRPQATITPTTSSININYNCLQFADTNGAGHAGITFDHTISCPDYFAGPIQWIQVNYSPVRQLQDLSLLWHSLVQKHPGPYLDTDSPYPYYDSSRTNAVDSPFLPLNDITNAINGSASDSFVMWMEFKPFSGEHWVPLRAISWSWSGSAANSSTGWRVTSGTSSFSPADGFDTQTYPQWKSNVRDVDWIP